jgi:hypothetical protein
LSPKLHASPPQDGSLAGDGFLHLDGVLLDGCADLFGALLDCGPRGLRLALYRFARGLGAAGNSFTGLSAIALDDGGGFLGIALDLGADFARILLEGIAAAAGLIVLGE